MKLNQYFDMREFIPPAEYSKIMKLAESDRINAFYKLIKPELVELAVFIREFFGKPMIINNWYKGGTYSLRGWRPLNCPIGAKNSDHKKKMAIDFNILGLTDDVVKEKIIENEKAFYKAGVRRMEHKDFATTWTHLSINSAVHHNGKINIFKP